MNDQNRYEHDTGEQEQAIPRKWSRDELWQEAYDEAKADGKTDEEAAAKAEEAIQDALERAYDAQDMER